MATAIVVMCDRCDHDAAWLVFAAYDQLGMPNGRVVARYPAPMHKTCSAHLADVLSYDLAAGPGSTGQWIVKPCPD